jgi:hypothetical protein
MIVKDHKASTFSVYSDAVVLAQNKHHISVFNGAGSGKIIRLRKLFFTNLALAGVTGVGIRMDLRKISTCTVGTDLTIQKHDSLTATLPATVLAKTGGTCTDAGLLAAFTMANDELLLTGNSQLDHQSINLLPEGQGIEPLLLREGEGITLQQITNSIVGSFGWYMLFTAESKLA